MGSKVEQLVQVCKYDRNIHLAASMNSLVVLGVRKRRMVRRGRVDVNMKLPILQTCIPTSVASCSLLVMFLSLALYDTSHALIVPVPVLQSNKQSRPFPSIATTRYIITTADQEKRDIRNELNQRHDQAKGSKCLKSTSRNDNLDENSGPPSEQRQRAQPLGSDFAVMGSSVFDSPMVPQQQQQQQRTPLADRIRQLHNQQPNHDDDMAPTSSQPVISDTSSTATNFYERSLDGDDQNELYLQVKQGIVQIKSKEQHAAFLQAHMDKLIVMKFKASYCRACLAIEGPFLETKNEPTLSKLPIVWAECIASMSNKVLFRQLSVLSLPTIHFYDNGQLIENFACGPAKIPMLRQKLVEVLTRRLDPVTLQLKPVVSGPLFPADSAYMTESKPTDITRSDDTAALEVANLDEANPRKIREIRIGDELIKQEHIDFLRKELPFFQSVSDDEFDIMLSKASLQTFLPGDIIIRQGRPGKTFFVIKSGTVEMCIRSRFELPISTPASYLGAVVNQLTKFDYFGERALTTGEPYMASVRVITKTRCFAFDAPIIPETSILSQKRRATQELVDQLTERYVLPGDYKESYNYPTTAKDECILELLVRFKQVRQTAKCFEYVMNAKPLLGNKGEIARRSMLVSKLSNSQRQDFIDVFQIADVHDRGTISLLEMRRFMESARTNVQYSDDELLDIIRKANPQSMDTEESTNSSIETDDTESTFGTTGITLNEFLGVMAEAEFYYLFTETFQELDQENTGYVRAGDLDEVLNGVRFLITDDRKSIIDVEDQDVQVDYEQFAKMLLGAAL